MKLLQRRVLGPVIALLCVLPSAAYAAGTPTSVSTAGPTAPVATVTSATATVPPPAGATSSAAVSPTVSPITSASPSPASSPITSASPSPASAPITSASPSPASAPATAPSQPPSPSPSVVPTVPPTPTPPKIADDAFTIWHGVVREGGAYRRDGPSGSADIEEELDPGTPIRVDDWVAGSALYPDVIAWGVVDPADGGGYIYGGSLAGILPPAVPPAPADMDGASGDWIDVNLTLNVVTMYEDGEASRMILTSPGRPGDETDTGLFSVRTRLTAQDMSGPGYYVPGVPSVQYFYGAEALHGRYWTLPDALGTVAEDVDGNGIIESPGASPLAGDGPNSGVAFGVPSSHGCLGMPLDDAAWLYSLTPVGTPVDVHY